MINLTATAAVAKTTQYATGFNPKTNRWTVYNSNGHAVMEAWTEAGAYELIDRKVATGSWLPALTAEEARELTGSGTCSIWRD